MTRFATFVIFISALVGVSCSKSHELGNVASERPTPNRDALQIGDTIDAEHFRIFGSTDTVLSFHKAGVTTKVIVPKSEAPPLHGFQDFLDGCSRDSLSYCAESVCDVTGDGMADTCKSRIAFRDGRPFIEHMVFCQGRQIWYDSLTLNDGGAAAEYWGGDEASYIQLKPYSALFVAEKGFSYFIGNKVCDDLQIGSYFLNMLHANDKPYWTNYLEHFRGNWIWYLTIVDDGGMIWDSRSGKFIVYWGPW